MFYCDTCAEERGWPETMAQSYGRCEVCKYTAVCNDMPSRYLPVPHKQSLPGDKE